MSTINEYEKVITEVQTLLTNNKEWENRYAVYADKVLNNQKTIVSNRQKFREWAALYLYMNLSNATGNNLFSLRYRGQNVANLTVNNGLVLISTNGFDSATKRDFDCLITLNNEKWQSKKARDFRKYFSANPNRTINARRQNEEHRIESLLLTEFSKKQSEDKKMCNIQPVRLAGIARFQMPTPLKASNGTLEYSKHAGGGIDISARVGRGNGVKLAILEVKDENCRNEPASKVIKQGLAYATFIRELLHSNGGQDWWKLFGFGGKVPKKISIVVSVVMPSNGNDDTSFANTEIKFPDNSGDSFSLNYIYFKEENNKIGEFSTSIKEVETA